MWLAVPNSIVSRSAVDEVGCFVSRRLVVTLRVAFENVLGGLVYNCLELCQVAAGVRIGGLSLK